MERTYLYFIYVFLVLVLSSCGGGDDPPNPTTDTVSPNLTQEATSSELMRCTLDPTEWCIKITLPCTDDTDGNEPLANIYGRAGWYTFGCNREVIEIPNKRPIYAFLVNGFDQNHNLNMFHFYNFAKCIFRRTEQLPKKAYVHFAWWNNLLAPYMKKPLHNDLSVPSRRYGAWDAARDYFSFLYDPNVTIDLQNTWFLSGPPTKAIPAEDYQFQQDARTVLKAIRHHNPNAAIILVGHSMGGDSVIRLAKTVTDLDDIKIDLLAPIDPVGNRTCLPFEDIPGMKPINMRWDNTTCEGKYNFTRFQATHTDWFWKPYRISFEDGNIKYLYHRWQNEYFFPFDYGCPENKWLCPLQLHMLSAPPDEVELPDAYLLRHDDLLATRINQGSTNVQDGIQMNRLSGTDVFPNLWFYNWGGESGGLWGTNADGHGEIVGFRALNPTNILQSYPLALAARGTWPTQLSRTVENCDSDAISPVDCERVQVLKQWENDPEYLETNGFRMVDGEAQYWAPQKPPQAYCDVRGFDYNSDYCTYCMVSGDLCSILRTKVDIPENFAPVADAGPDQIVECSASTETEVRLDGSGSSDPNSGDSLNYNWVWPLGTVTGEKPYAHFPLGTHTITLTVDDGSLSDMDTVDITVQDTIAPTLSVTLSPNVLWPPNHKLVKITASIDVNDTCDNSPTIKLVSITSNETDDGKGDGHTSDDIQGAEFGTDDREFLLRAERSGHGTDRIYTVTYEVTDASGNVTVATAKVTVPHDHGKSK